MSLRCFSEHEIWRRISEEYANEHRLAQLTEERKRRARTKRGFGKRTACSSTERAIGIQEDEEDEGKGRPVDAGS